MKKVRERRLIPHCADCILVEYLDEMVKDPEDPDYQLVRKRIQDMAKRANNRNPFRAGRPERFLRQEKEMMLEMRKAGKTYREISEEFDCSTSVVSRAINDLQSR